MEWIQIVREKKLLMQIVSYKQQQRKYKITSQISTLLKMCIKQTKLKLELTEYNLKQAHQYQYHAFTYKFV